MDTNGISFVTHGLMLILMPVALVVVVSMSINTMPISITKCLLPVLMIRSFGCRPTGNRCCMSTTAVKLAASTVVLVIVGHKKVFCMGA